MNTRTYKVSDLKKIIMESANEFKPVMGKNVESDNKKNNDKAYKESSSKTKTFDGGARKVKKEINYPYSDNQGMENIQYDNINDDFKKRAKSQLKGYVSSEAEKLHKNDDFGNAEFNDIKYIDDKDKALRKGKELGKEIGLTSRELAKDSFNKLTDSIFENKFVKLRFKNTLFLSEGHMMSKIPDDFKVEGKKFIMEDKNNNQYIVEWHVDDEPNVINKNKINEQKNRIKELFNYRSGNSMTNNKMRIAEEDNISLMLSKSRKLLK